MGTQDIGGLRLEREVRMLAEVAGPLAHQL